MKPDNEQAIRDAIDYPFDGMTFMQSYLMWTQIQQEAWESELAERRAWYEESLREARLRGEP